MSTASVSNSDAPYATVPLGPSEYVGYVVALGSFLNGTFGQDYGVGKNAQALSILVAGLILLGQGLARAMKHQSAMHANALTYAARIAQAAAAVVVPQSPAASVTNIVLPRPSSPATP